MVRELLEGCMFCITNLGAVVKTQTLSGEQKKKFFRILIPCILSGVSTGLLISIGIGVSLTLAVGNPANASYGVEVGEGISKLIGAFFVTDLVLKIPKWFNISNCVHAEKKKSEMNNFGNAWEMGFVLFWNVLRESLEGGTLTAIAVVLNAQSQEALGNSVLVAIAAAIVLACIFGLGAKYISAKFFGVMAAILAQLLAMGLWTGATRSFEEVYALNHGGEEDGGSPLIYNYEGTTLGNELTILEFIGFSYSLTALTLSVWVLSLVLLTFFQIYINYYGYQVISEKYKKCKCVFQKLSCTSQKRRGEVKGDEEKEVFQTIKSSIEYEVTVV